MTYTVDNNLEAVQSLAAGQVLPDSIDATSYDGNIDHSSHDYGTNDGPVLSVRSSSDDIEDDSTFTFVRVKKSDVDTTDTLSVDVSSIAPVSGDASGISMLTALSRLTRLLIPIVGGDEVVTFGYLVEDGNGGSVEQTATPRLWVPMIPDNRRR